jgi:hypothetical protein
MAFAATAGALPLQAQRGVQLEVVAPPRAQLTTTGPAVTARGVLADRELRDLLRSGFPARLYFRVELWSSGGFFNDLERQVDWHVIVLYDPLEQLYRVARIVGEGVTSLGTYSDVTAAEAALSLPFRPPITVPRRDERLYYRAKLDVEMLSLSDLDEVERWLRGELRPAVRGQRNPGTALTRGVRTLLVRLLGGERRHYEVRTGTFRP